jgi:hypothetical protein
VDTNRPFQFNKRSQLFVGMHNKTLSIAAMCVCNPDRSPAAGTSPWVSALARCPEIARAHAGKTLMQQDRRRHHLWPCNCESRPQLGQANRRIRYSLIISLETDAADVDLYTPIATEIAAEVPIKV